MRVQISIMVFYFKFNSNNFAFGNLVYIQLYFITRSFFLHSPLLILQGTDVFVVAIANAAVSLDTNNKQQFYKLYGVTFSVGVHAHVLL